MILFSLFFRKVMRSFSRRTCGFLFLVCVLSHALPAQEAPVSENAADQPVKRLYPALLGVGFSNGLIYSINRYAMKSGFTYITPEWIKKNLSEPWVWDTDPFPTNHLLHPYSGGTTFAAGRAAGFDFYESFFFSAAGSFTWEALLEAQTPAINDFIVTTFSGGMVGEMLHRLYLEINSPFSVLVSPTDSFVNLITGSRPRKTGGENLHLLSVSLGLGWMTSAKKNVDDNETLYSWNTPRGDVGLHLIYGNPFSQQSRIPYEQFELWASAGLGSEWYDLMIISDGYLLSFSPLAGVYNKLSTGLSLSYDFFTGPDVIILGTGAPPGLPVLNLHNQGINWAAKYQHLFPGGSRMELKAHLGWLALGGSFFFDASSRNTDRTISIYGNGINAKLFFSYNTPSMGRLDMMLMSYSFKSISYYRPEMEGWELINFANVFYTFPLGKRLSLSIGDAFGIKTGLYEKVPSITQAANSIKVLAEWNFFRRD